MDRVVCSLHMAKTQQEEEEVKSDSKKGGGSTVLDEPYELEEKIDDMASTPSEWPQEEPTITQDRMLSGTTANDAPMEQG